MSDQSTVSHETPEVVRIEAPEVVVTGQPQLRDELLRLLGPLGLATLWVDGRVVRREWLDQPDPDEAPIWMSLEHFHNYARNSGYSSHVATRAFWAAFRFAYRNAYLRPYRIRGNWGYPEVDIRGIVRYVETHGYRDMPGYRKACHAFVEELHEESLPVTPVSA